MPPPPATLTAVRASEALFLGLAAHGVHKRFWVRPAKGQPEPVTDSSASLLTLAFVLLLGFLFSTALVATPEQTYSAGIHQTFGPCGYVVRSSPLHPANSNEFPTSDFVVFMRLISRLF